MLDKLRRPVMENQKENSTMLNMIIRPGFRVRDNRITEANQAAQALLLTPGTDVRSLLLTGEEEYAAFQGGCLWLKLSIFSQSFGASVRRMDGADLFLLDQESDDGALRALALAARELREPLANIMLAAKSLVPEDPGSREQAARLSRGLHQLLRIVGNMSDAGTAAASRQEIRDIGSVFAEIFEKAGVMVEQTGVHLSYQGLSETVYCLADADQLERAVLNTLSNAIKFTPKDGSISASLTRRGRMLRLSIQDTGSGIAENILGNLFSRYLRQPGIEDSRYGIGLGLVLIRSAAASHGGTVLIDRPEGTGTRITLTLAIRQNSDGMLRSPAMRVDYTGEWDHCLTELSECLPLSAYEKEL